MKKNIKTLITIFFIPALAFCQDYKYPFQNPDLSIEKRVENIISLLTLDEKISCLSTNPGVPRLAIKGTGHVEGLHGLAQGGPAKWGSKIFPPIPTTMFPQAYGLGETWDPEMIHLVASIEGYETRYIFQSPKYKRGDMVVRAPNADLGRDPRWGRTEECYGEDAFFNGVLATSFSKGLQGDHPVYWQTASLLKHFLANSNENSRDSSSSDFDERLWREYYSVPFREAIIKGGANCYMAAYNKYNGIPATVHPMLKEITMKEWGVNGIICTDGGAYTMLVNSHHYYPDLNLAAAGCIKAGINQFLDKYREGTYAALANGYLTVKDIEEVIKGNFRVMIKLGLLDPQDKVPYSIIGIKDTIDPWRTEKHKSAAKLVTQKSIVLLKNEKNTLPLNKSKLKSIAVIGPRGHEVDLDWYSGDTLYAITAFEGIKNKMGSNASVKFAANNNYDKAVELAKASDVAIVCVGNHPNCNSMSWKDCPTPSNGREAVDRKSISLEDEQLIQQVFKANPNTIVVLISSFPYAVNWTQENVPAILHMANNSQELGSALADVLFGDFNPGGRLTQTWPKSMDQLPPMMDYNIRNGRTYMYFKGQPLYPFGYGLSYSTFEYSNPKLSSKELKKGGNITVSVDVKNNSSKDGDEVVQLYVKYLKSAVVRPMKELKGFKRVTIKAGETKNVQINLNAKDLAYWDGKKHEFVVENGELELLIGASSADIKNSVKVAVKE
jgi:beta-glucosidase